MLLPPPNTVFCVEANPFNLTQADKVKVLPKFIEPTSCSVVSHSVPCDWIEGC